MLFVERDTFFDSAVIDKAFDFHTGNDCGEQSDTVNAYPIHSPCLVFPQTFMMRLFSEIV